MMQHEMSLAPLRARIVAVFPELSSARFEISGRGWHSVAVECDGRLIFKFPLNQEAEAGLRREARLLAALRSLVRMTVPDLVLCADEPVFSRHVKIPGEHLLTGQYRALPNRARGLLAVTMAQFYADLHAVGVDRMRKEGAVPIKPWLRPEHVLQSVWSRISPDLRPSIEQLIAQWSDLPPDPHGTVYGFFDGHGWNMAFDHEVGRLNGIYDFADSGFGALHQEFIYTDMIDRDLTDRVMVAYEKITGRLLDRQRVETLSGALKLSELAEYADDPEHGPGMLAGVEAWLSRDACGNCP